MEDYLLKESLSKKNPSPSRRPHDHWTRDVWHARFAPNGGQNTRYAVCMVREKKSRFSIPRGYRAALHLQTTPMQSLRLYLSHIRNATAVEMAPSVSVDGIVICVRLLFIISITVGGWLYTKRQRKWAWGEASTLGVSDGSICTTRS